jgi:hypothetical protein
MPRKKIEKPPVPRAVIPEPVPQKNNKVAKILWTTAQWLLITTVLFFVWRGFHYRIPDRREMPGYLVVLFGLSAAYVWVDILKWGVTKPFNCLTCMAGWICLILAVTFHVHYWYLYLALGAFAGGLFTAIKLRWL